MVAVSTFTIESKLELQAFLDFYFSYNKKSIEKVKWQLSDKNSFLGKIHYKIHTVKKEDSIVGSIISFINPFVKIDNKTIGQFGFLEFIDDITVFKSLIVAVEKFFIENGISYYLGPINFSTWDNYRLKTDQFEEKPYLFEPNNPVYYSSYFEKEKFHVAKTYITRELTHEKEINNKLEKKFLKMADYKIKIEKFNFKNFESEMKILYEFVKKNFNTNFLYTDTTFEEFYKTYYSLKDLINPNLFLIAKNSDSEIIGFIFGMVDLLNPATPCALLKTLAVDEEYRNLGVGAALMFQIHKEVHKLNITRIKHCLMAEDNISTNYSESNDTLFTYKLFGKNL